MAGAWGDGFGGGEGMDAGEHGHVALAGGRNRSRRIGAFSRGGVWRRRG